jgi:predicted Rossmann fold nucleotide-binding protein DprA/Smf involved in DNA uptake
MNNTLTQNSQAILLLTAPLMPRRLEVSADLLTSSEYRRLAVFLLEAQKQPRDLLTADADDLIRQCQRVVDGDRLRRLLGRGFLLSQAVEHWQARAIWVITSTDPTYPRKLEERLKDDAPAVLYGCGDATILATGGLAVVGSHNATPALLTYAGHIGQLVAHTEQTVVSGGVRGIDQTAMSGALEAGGKAVGVLADSLERAVLNRDYRSPLMEGKLALASPNDPMAGFNVGNVMQCNKLIYALADAGLVISCDDRKGVTWPGAVEQLTRLKLVPVFVRSRGDTGKGLQELQGMGALPWPNPTNASELVRILTPETDPNTTQHDENVALACRHESTPERATISETEPTPAKHRARPTKSTGNAVEPTLFDASPETDVPNKHATTSREKTGGGTDAEGGGINHAES